MSLTLLLFHSFFFFFFLAVLTYIGYFKFTCIWIQASQVAIVVKNLPANAGDIRDWSSIPGLGRTPGGGHGNQLQYPCLENSMNRRACWPTGHEVTKSWTWLMWLSARAHTHTHTHTLEFTDQIFLAVSKQLLYHPGILKIEI